MAKLHIHLITAVCLWTFQSLWTDVPARSPVDPDSRNLVAIAGLSEAVLWIEGGHYRHRTKTL